MSKLDRYTLGKSPAAIYLVEYLNEHQNLPRKNRNVLKLIAEFRKNFYQLVDARAEGHVPDSIVSNYCSMKRVDLDSQCPKMETGGYDPLVVNLYRNIIIGELKSYLRRSMKYARLLQSGLARAREIAKNIEFPDSVSAVSFESFAYYGKEGHRMDVAVTRNGTYVHNLTFKYLSDDTTEKKLQQRSKNKLAKRGKPNTYY